MKQAWSDRLEAIFDPSTLTARGRAIGHRLLDSLFPPQPIELDTQKAHDFAAPAQAVMATGLSPDVWSGIRFIDREGCDMCARPFEGGLYLGAGSHCTDCTEKPFSFGRGRAACLYDVHSKGLILAHKHGDRLDLNGLLAGWVSRGASDILAECDAIVPVPLHPFRLLHRRYNQAAEIARTLSQQQSKAYLPEALRRIRRTASQGHASARQRWENVKNAFVAGRDGARDVRGRHIVLIDDVFTTGSTLEACSRVLLSTGARRVDVAIIARAVREI